MIAFVFPGQGSQRVGMGKALAAAHSVCRETFEQADDVLGEPLSRLCFEGPSEQLALTEHTQPAVLVMSTAVHRLLAARGHAAAVMAGHSLGEYSAHVAAGTLGYADALRTVRRRGLYMQEAVPVGQGAMAAVLELEADDVRRACAEAARGDVVGVANINAPGQVVIAGQREAVTRAGERARELGARRVMALDVSAPFHCALMKPAEERLARDLRALVVADPPCRSWPTSTPDRNARRRRRSTPSFGRSARPVQWESVVRRMVADGVTTFIELGPGKVLSRLIRQTAPAARVAQVGDPRSLEAAEALLAGA